MSLIIFLFMLAIDALILVIILQVAMSWLVAFDIVNADNQAAQNLMALLHKITDPIYKPIKKYIPPIGNIDVTPIVVIIGLSVIESIVIGALL